MIKGNHHENLRDEMVSNIVSFAEYISGKVVCIKNKKYNELDRKVDNILTSKTLDIPAMIALLGIIFWMIIKDANIPSEAIVKILFGLEEKRI